MSEESAPPRTMTGIGLAALGYGCFSVQDATVKWLVGHFAVAEVLCARSVVILLLAICFGGAERLAALRRSPAAKALILRAALILIAWLSYYSAARHLGLAQLTTLYFAAPIVVTVLSVVLLDEKVDLVRWAAVLAGFAGVVIAANPHGGVDLLAAGAALFAAGCWASSVVLVRLISRTETTINQMLVSNALFALASGIMLVWAWRTPDPLSCALMLMLGVLGGLGQYFVYEGFRYAPASVIAPIEYTGLVWAFFYGYVIWADIPAPQVFLGAALIVASSLAFVWIERRRARPSLRAKKA